MQSPEANLIDPAFNFTNCDGALEFNVTVFDDSSPSSNDTYTIDWGDGSAIWSDTNAPVNLSHLYDGLGTWTIIYTIEGNNGCTDIQEILVANVTNPAIGAGTTGNTTVCGPVELCFNLSLYETNHESTTYTVDFGDGSPTQTFNHPPPDQVCHTYSTSSCASGVPYIFSVLATNICSFSEGTISPIVIYSPPTAGFYPEPVPQCVNVPVSFINTSELGYYTNCAQNGTFIWDFGDGSAPVFSFTNDNQSHPYSDPGTYTVTLESYNACNNGDPNIFTQEVCIEEPPVVAFDAGPLIGCAPFTMTTTNNSVVNNVCTILYDWEVSTLLLDCTSSNPNYEYANGTNANSEEPAIQFNSPGQYQVSMTMENSCGIFTDIESITVQDEPQANLNILPNICAGQSVNPSVVVDDCLAAITSYAWTFENGSPANSANANPGSVTFNTAGNWDVDVDITNACGTTSLQTNVTVEPTPDINISSSAGLEICANSSTVLTASGANTYTWDWDATLSTTNGPVTTATPGSTTTYSVTGYSPAGCPGTEDITITVNPLPIIDPIDAYEICNGESIEIGVDITSGEAPYDNYNWSPSGSLDEDDISNPTASPTITTNYTVTVMDNNDCTGQGNVLVTVNPLPIVNAGPDIQLCNQPVPEQLTGFSPIAGAGESGVWTGPNVTADGIFTPPGIGFYDLTYTFIDIHGCESFDTMTIEVIDPINADAGPDLEFCESGIDELLAGVTPGGVWSGTNVLANGTFTPSPDGIYNLTYSIGGGSCLSTDDIIVEVFELPEPDAGTDEIICEGDSIQLSGSVSNGSAPYSNPTWSPAGTLSNDTIFDPFATPLGTQVYTIEITDDNNCTNTDDVLITVNPSATVEAGPDVEFCDQPIAQQLTGFSPLPGPGETGVWSGPNIDTDGIFTPNGAGTFVVTYTFTNTIGCVSSDSLTVTVIDPTNANAGPDFDICLFEDPVQLAQPGTWTGQDVTVTGLFTPNTDGIFTLNFSLGSGTCETFDSLQVTVYTLPTADAGEDLTICDGGEVQLNGSGDSDNLPIILYSWSGSPDIDPTDVADPMASPTVTTAFNLTVVDDVGCSGQDQVTVFVSELPTVEAGPDITLCNQSIPEVLTGFSPLPGVGETGVWSGTGISDPSGEFTSPGIPDDYTVYYTFTDAGGCSDMDSIIVMVIDPVVADAGPLQEICLNNGLYQLQGYSPIADVTWSGTGITDAENGIFDPLLSLDGDFTLTIEFGAGTCYSVDSTVITVNPLPVVDAGSDEDICGNMLPFNLTGFSPADGIWEGTGIIDQDLGTFDPSIGPDDYDVFYWYTDPITGCADTSYKVVTVYPVPESIFTLDTLGCTNSAVQLSNNSIGADSYEWDFGNTDTDTDIEPNYTYPDEGFYTIELIAINEFDCQDTTYLVNEIINPPSASLTLDPYEGCAPLEVTFTNNSVGQYLTYLWDLDIALTADFEPEPLVYQQEDDIAYYPITLSATNFCGTDVANDSIAVFPQPVAGFGTNLDVDCSPFVLEINNNSVGNPDFFDWDFGDGTGSGMEEPGTHTFYTDSVPTDYTITLIISNECGIDTADYTITVMPNTVTAFFNTNVTEGCSPLEVEFTDYSDGGTVISYDFGDGNFTGDDNPTYVFDEEGLYTVVQYVNNGCSYDTAFMMIEIFPSPILDFTTDVPNVCQNEPVQFINLSEDVNGLSWDFGDGDTSNVSNPFHLYEGGGSFTVTLSGTSQFNECESEIQQTFTVFAAPEAGFSVLDSVGCSPFTVDFNNTTDGGLFYSWDFGDSNTDNTPNPSNTFYNFTADPALYTVTLSVENFELCTDVFQANIIVSPTPIADFNLSQYESCYFPTEITTTNNTQFANGYEWDFGVLGTSDLVEPSFTIDDVGTFPVSLLASNSYGCEHSAVSEVVIHPLPEADFSTDVQSGCVTLEVNFNNQSFGAVDYEWNFGDGSSSASSSPFHSYSQFGLYDVSLVVTSDQGCMDTLLLEDHIAAYPLPTAAFTFSPEEFSVYDADVQFEDLSAGAANWFWNFGDGAYANVQHPEHIYQEAGIYTVQLDISTIYGCIDHTARTLVVDDQFNFFVPNAFTPDNDGINDVFFPVIVGKGMIEFYEFKIFDRWGIKIFETNDPDEPWIGDFRGRGDYYVNDDVYNWQAKFRLIGADESKFYYGHVTQVR